LFKRLGRRSVLRTGYTAVIGVLVFSAFEAYRIQTSVSQEHLEIYRHYVDQEKTLTTLRRNLWLTSIYVRDFFIRTTPDQAERLESQLRELQAENDQEVNRLARLMPDNAAISGLRNGLNMFWSLMDPVPGTMLHSSTQAQIEFLQREIVPRREELYSALIDLSGTDQKMLQNNEKQFAGSRRKAAERLSLMLGLGILLAILVALFSLRHAENLQQQADRHYAEVEEAKRELQQLSARLLEIEEEDRRRLSRELHDEIGQTLALLQIQITNAQAALQGQPAVLREQLQRARALAEKTVQTIRNISLLLRPALLDDLGLVPALQFQLEDFLQRSGIAAEFEEDNVPEQLPDAVKTCVYRIVQEALHNCEKHSGAHKVRVTVRQLPDCLAVEVADDGKGFVLNEKRMPNQTNGLGLLGIRERVALVGGSLTIDSAPSQGTRIALRIPAGAPIAAAARATGNEVTV
jgi:signal transduction histidine kinase